MKIIREKLSKPFIFLGFTLLFLITINSNVANGQNNKNSKNLPDLIVIGEDISSTVVKPGTSVNIACTVQNYDAGDAGSSWMGYYLSTNTSYESSDTYLGESYVSSISAGNYKSISTYLKIPSDTEPGTYYILFYADREQEVSESNEFNNVAYIQLTVPYPDLITTNQWLSEASVSTGESVSLSCWVQNTGSGDADENKTGFYLSSDNVYDVNDIFLGYDQVYGISSGSTNTMLSKYVTIPSKTIPGNYYILYKADYLNEVNESDESNNVTYKEIAIKGSDLTINSPSANPLTLVAGNSISLSCLLQNYGNGNSPSGQIGYYLSSDNTYDANDIFIDSYSFYALNSGNSTTCNKDVTIPLSAPSGTQYILYFADYNNSIAEEDETNNVTSVQIFVEHPDLTVTNQSLTPTVIQTGSVDVTLHVENIGAGYANNSEIAYYLSTDNLYDISDVYLGQETVTALASGENDIITSTISIPSGLSNGTYNIIYYVDYLENINETDDDNNTAYNEITINYPDLQVINQSLSLSNLNSGDEFSVSFDVKNFGLGDASSSQVNYYLSTDTQYDESDILLGNEMVSSVTAGAHISTTANLTISEGTASGTYYVLVYADFTEIVAEIDDANNISNSQVDIILPVYTIATSVTPVNGGTITGDGIYYQAEICNLTASSKTGHSFINWTEDGIEVSTDANYSFSVSEDRTLVANFEIESYDIALSANPSNGGTVTGSGTYAYGETINVSVTPEANYTFVNWTENGIEVSTDANYSFTAIDNRTLVANFEYKTCQITLSADPWNVGTVSGGGTYKLGETVNISATSDYDDYEFINWTENEVEVSTDADYSFAATESRTLVANFEYITFEIELTADPANGGVLYGAGTYGYGQVVDVAAWSEIGYNFVNWTYNGNEVTTDTSFSFYADYNYHLIAHFEPESYNITATANPSTGGTVTGNGEYNYEETAILSAVEETGYNFVSWTENGTEVSTDINYSFIVEKNRALIANFEQITSSVHPNLEMVFRIYPNPTSNVLNIEFDNNTNTLNTIEIININGQKVYSMQSKETKIKLNISEYNKGIYIIKVSGNGYTNKQKVLFY